MSSEPTVEVPRHWREEQPVEMQALPRRPRRRLRAFFILALMLAVLGIVVGLLSWLKPVADPVLVPLWITEYRSRVFPFLPMAEQDRQAFQEGGYFSKLGDSARQEGQALLQQLTALKNYRSHQPLVVYLCSHALCDAEGAVQILPGDADPDNSRSWISLRDVLERLRECPAAEKLLVLDIMWPLAGGRLGVVYSDVAAAMPAELEAVPDEQRLVFCACSPGQQSLASEEMGRSVFSFYLEEGLRGYADGFLTGRRQGQISVQELAGYVQARVDRWVQHNRARRQTPVLYGGTRDYPLRAIEGALPRPHLPAAKTRDFSPRLIQLWKKRDHWWNDAIFPLAPRAFHKVQAVLLEAEKDFCGFYDISRIDQTHLLFLDHLEQVLDRAHSLVKPVFLSLSQELTYKTKADDSLHKAVADLFANLKKHQAEAKPKEGQAGRDKLLAEFIGKYKGGAPFAFESAVWSWALGEANLDPGMLENIGALLQGMGPPRYLETLLLRQLGALAQRVDAASWPGETVLRALDVSRRGELAIAQTSNALPWVHALLEEASQLRHEGEMRLWARGFASFLDADLLQKKASDRFDIILDFNDKINRSQNKLFEALALLPGYRPYLEAAPNLQPIWGQAAATARNLANALLEMPPHHTQKEHAHDLDELTGTINDFQKNAQQLADLLEQLNNPFQPAQVSRLIKMSKQPQADANLYRQLETLLSVPHPLLKAEDRQAVWTAARVLARRLHEETRRLDADDDHRQQTTAAPGFWDAEAGQREQTVLAGLRARSNLNLLELAGLPAEKLQPLQKALAGGAAPEAARLRPLGLLLRRLWTMDLPAYYQQHPSLPLRDRLSWLLPPLDSIKVVDEGSVTAATAWRQDLASQLWIWLGDRYRYQARDYQGCGLDTPEIFLARQFYTNAFLVNQDLAALPKERYASLQTATPVPRLSGTRPTVEADLVIQRYLPPGDQAGATVRLSAPDNNWLRVAPPTLVCPAATALATSQVLVDKRQVQITLQPDAERSYLPPPLGLLGLVQLNGRVYHAMVPIPLPGTGTDVSILVSQNPKEPEPALSEIRLRPGGLRQPFYLFVRNSTGKSRKLLAEVQAGDELLQGGKMELQLAPGETVRLKLPDLPLPKDGAGLPPLLGPLFLRLRDLEQQKALVFSRTLPVGVASPRDYVRLSDVQFLPPNPKSEGKNRLTVKLQTQAAVSGPPIPAELVLSAGGIPGLLSVGGGTLRGELLTKGKQPTLVLFADNIQLAEEADEDGMVYVNVDGLARTFILRTTFSRRGDPLTPRGDGRSAIRIVTDPFAAASAKFAVIIEVDNAPDGATLDAALGRLVSSNGADNFEADLVRTFPTPKAQTIGFTTGPAGALLFTAAVADWRVPLDVSKIIGQRLVRARLRDDQGNVIAQTIQPVTIDNSLPRLVRFVAPPAKAPRSVPLTLVAETVERDAGITQALFFQGRPQDGKIPPTALAITGEPVDALKIAWKASITLPEDLKGPTPFSVQFLNRAGLTSFATTVVELTDTDPAKTGPGRIKGKVTDGGRPQAGLDVVLRDEKGAEKTRTKTKEDGSFLFDNVPPGKYSLFCRQTAFRRQALVAVTVEPLKTATAALALSL